MSRLFDYIAAVAVGMNVVMFVMCAALGLWWAALLNVVMASFNFHFSYTAIMGEVKQ